MPVDFDGLEMELTFVVPGPFTLTRARSPDVPPRERESLYLETHGSAATFTTRFTPR
ncbi:MAG: hypothetical protein KJ072_03545 [Verrucomicrobia bacterium]|nr:hypothetical protein [Verrucomicrobiota bacterium]